MNARQNVADMTSYCSGCSNLIRYGHRHNARDVSEVDNLFYVSTPAEQRKHHDHASPSIHSVAAAAPVSLSCLNAVVFVLLRPFATQAAAAAAAVAVAVVGTAIRLSRVR